MAQLCQHLRQHLRLLESPLTADVDAMIAAAIRDQNACAVRDFKSKLDGLTLAYEPLIERLARAAETRSSVFPTPALRDAAKAEMHANALYAWACTFVPTNTDVQTERDKASKLQMMPYIVAMAYAVRAKLDVYYVESSDMDGTERLEHLERCRKIVEEFVATIKVAVRVTLHDSSLLDVALDYPLALTTYMALMAAMRASVQMMLKPSDAPKAIALWDDGLDTIR